MHLMDSIPLPSSKGLLGLSDNGGSRRKQHPGPAAPKHLSLLKDPCYVDRGKALILKTVWYPNFRAPNTVGHHSTAGAAGFGGTLCWGRGEAVHKSDW